jgi:hypothetical protein
MYSGWHLTQVGHVIPHDGGKTISHFARVGVHGSHGSVSDSSVAGTCKPHVAGVIHRSRFYSNLAFVGVGNTSIQPESHRGDSIPGRR